MGQVVAALRHSRMPPTAEGDRLRTAAGQGVPRERREKAHFVRVDPASGILAAALEREAAYT